MIWTLFILDFENEQKYTENVDYMVVRMLARLPVTLDRPSRPPDKEIFKYIQAYFSMFEVFLKNI
jgi:hypothetical protein